MMARCKLNPCCGSTMPGECDPPPQIKPNEGWEAYEKRVAKPVYEADGEGIEAIVDAVQDVILLDWFSNRGNPEAARRVVVTAVVKRTLAALAKPASSPAGGDVARAIYEGMGYNFNSRTINAMGQPYGAWAKAVDCAQRVAALSQSTSAGRAE